MKRESQAARKRRAAEILKRLKARFPEAKCELNWTTPLELAVATILSAQCTDRRVNLTTPALFAKYRTARDWADSPEGQLEEEIRATGFFRNKARNIRGLMRRVAEEYGGELPRDFETLTGLPGIGRKTANLLVATLWGEPGLVVDTHFIRMSNRLGFVEGEKDPAKIEKTLGGIVEKGDWTAWSHAMVFQGRYCCAARRPACGECAIAELCPSRER